MTRAYDVCIDYLIARKYGANETAWAYHVAVMLAHPVERLLAAYRAPK